MLLTKFKIMWTLFIIKGQKKYGIAISFISIEYEYSSIASEKACTLLLMEKAPDKSVG